MAEEHRSSSDDALFQELRTAVAETSDREAGGLEVRIMTAAKAAFTWRTVDTDLEFLALCYDSSLEEVAFVRGTSLDPARTLIFEGETIVVGVEVGTDVLTGQLSPAQPGSVVLMTPQGWCGETEGDEAGFFLLARPSPGPVRLECHTEDAHLVTDWVSL